MLDINNIVIFIVGAIFLFAIFDLIVGVSNDAINFLSPSVGSKVASYRNIIIVASLGILFGSIFSSGMMEVARKGIFHPQYFTFFEIIILFLGVIIADILLLNKFNSLGMPTSTTVSIVFCLLGGAVGVGVLKIIQNDLSIEELENYINTGKVLTIILGILGSVVASFGLGTIVQYITRGFFTFHYENKPKYWVAILGSIAITTITHFILVKGLKGSAITGYSELISWVKSNLLTFLSLVFIIGFFLLQILLLLKVNVFRIIVLIGTFSLAMAFAGNDLVNFIGVPLAALKSYTLFSAETNLISDPNLFFMDGLNKKEKANIFLLLAGGFIMILTIIFSKKAKRVLNTGLSLGRQNEGKEQFGSSYLSKSIVRNFIKAKKALKTIIPAKIWNFIGSRFEQTQTSTQKKDIHFDCIRASVILICASILISIATSYKLPLSTTYVTFMVAMGTAFADKSWGRESAVYRVNGVLSVIIGWFLTAFGAFLFAFTMVNIIYLGGNIVAIVMIFVTIYVMVKPLLCKNTIQNTDIIEDTTKTLGTGFLEGVKKNITLGEKYYTKMLDNLGKENISAIKKGNKEIALYKETVYSFKKELLIDIANRDDTDIKSLSTYIGVLNSMKSYAKSLKFISESVTEHIDNNHVFSELEYKSLSSLNTEMSEVYAFLYKSLESKNFSKDFKPLTDLMGEINKYIEEDVERVKGEKVDIVSSILYIGILHETKYLLLEIGAIYRRCGEI